MSRSKKSRRLKSVVSVKTGSKSQLIEQTGKKGQIASKNKLSKHKNRQKSAFAKAQQASSANKPTPKTQPSITVKNKHKQLNNQNNQNNEIVQMPQTVNQDDQKERFEDLTPEQLLDFFEILHSFIKRLYLSFLITFLCFAYVKMLHFCPIKTI